MPVLSFPKALIVEHFGAGYAKAAYWNLTDGYWLYHGSKVPPNKIGKGTVIGPSVGVGKGAVIGENCVLGKGTYINAEAVIGNDVLTGHHVNIGTNCKIGNGVSIGSEAVVEAGAKLMDGCTVADEQYVSTGQAIAASVKPRTQKARGVKSLKNRGFATPEYSLIPIEDFSDEAKISQLFGKFVRPCPMTPRHGFVDSRPIKNRAEAMTLLVETKKADPQAEVLVMPFIEALYSGIWTPGSLTIGPGNDGATAGHGSVRIPIQGKPNNRNWSRCLIDAGITEQPYLELLWKKGTNDHDRFGRTEKRPYETVYVQLRNGPTLPASVDFIPKPVTVKRVVPAAGDLLEWETKTKGLAPGTVVYHPGGSLASHYAVHAVLNNIPVLISRKPKVGELLEPCSETKEPDIDQIKAGFVLGCRMESSYAAACRVMLAGCHSTSVWLGRYDILLGLALGATYRLMVTAGLGEARHNKDGVYHGKKGREAIYEACWNKVLNDFTRKKFIQDLYVFKNGYWAGGYGGEKWFLLCQWAGKIYNALLENDAKLALEHLNGAVHAVHNGGWAFNKFVCESEMNVAAVNPLVPFLEVIPQLVPYITDPSLSKTSAKWWKNRTKMDVSGESKTEKEEPQGELDQGTDPCDCKKPNCKNCYPDGTGCDCGEHTCKGCNPNGCSCACKECHDCGTCSLCISTKLEKGLAKHKGTKLGRVNYGSPDACFSCGDPNPVYKVKVSTSVIASCPVHAIVYANYPIVLLSEDPHTPLPTAPPPITLSPVAPQAVSTALAGTTTMYVTHAQAVANWPVSNKPKPAKVVCKAQARFSNDPAYLHVQYMYVGGDEHLSGDVKVPSECLVELKKFYKAKSDNDMLLKSWSSKLVLYLPLTKTEGEWWTVGNVAISIPNLEIKQASKG